MSTFPNETAFIKAHLNIISPLPISYSDAYQPPLGQYPRKIPVFAVDLPPPAPPKFEDSPSVASTIRITFKSSKPPIAFPLTVSVTDTISTIKRQLAAEPRAPPADIQRLILKGKALADSKLLKEYPIADGAVVNLMIKPSSHWDGSDATPSTYGPPATAPVTVPVPSSTIPSLIISPSPSTNGSPSPRPAPLPVELDTTFPPVPQAASEISSFHTTISSPEFWDRMHLFLRTEFANREDAAEAFEQFLIASKGFLTVGEIAKIRDQVGVVGMAGT